MLNRRSLIRGLFVAPAIIRTPGLLMPIKPLLVEPLNYPVQFMNVQPAFDEMLAPQWLVQTMQDELAKLVGLPPSVLFGCSTGAVIKA